jgi:hypothetical protein
MEEGMRFSFWQKAATPLLLLAHLTLYTCSLSDREKPSETILARVKDRTITLNEFLQRAEYGIRPPYCRGNTTIEKSIVLNTLIAEKMFALEAGDSNALAESPRFNNHILGRKEQAMREWLLQQEGFEKVTLSEEEVQQSFDVAGRTYHLYYFNIPDRKSADRVKALLGTPGHTFDELYEMIWGLESIPERSEGFFSSHNDPLHTALFSTPLRKDQLIGPVRVDDQTHMLLKIKGWTDQPAITEDEKRQRRADVARKLGEIRAFELFEKFVSKGMKGKKLEFARDTFFKLAEIVKPIYLTSKEDFESLFGAMAFQQQVENSRIKEANDKLAAILDQPLLNIDGDLWTVQRFKEEFERHPLVFRKYKYLPSEFVEQFRLAVADMVRDSYLTAEAYRRGYDRVPHIEHNVFMWQDALFALYHKQQVLDKYGVTSDSLSVLSAIETYLNPYVSQLQQKYSDDIEVNVEAYNSIKLTRIDMFVYKKNAPYPIVVPSFPRLTTSHRLQYGRKMENP